MVVNKYEKIIEWLKDYDPLNNDWTFFNVVTSDVDTMSVNSVESEREIKVYLDGSREVEFLFSVAMVKEFDIGTSNINLEALQEFENLASWVEEQNDEGNFPDFGENALIGEIEPTSTSPSVTIDSQTNQARYQGQFRITYMEER